VVANLEPERAFDVTVVPHTGVLQRNNKNDVNHHATQLAERLGGSTKLVLAPLFAESREQRDMLMQMSSIKEVFDLARKAAIALVGIGSIQAPGSSYYDLIPEPSPDRALLVRNGIAGEFLAHLIRDNGAVADYPLNSRLVALSPSEISQCPRTIGVAAGAEKVVPIQAALSGHLLNSLVVDEATATAVLRTMESVQHVA
jgi:DNA-binding transcriptional regulator LsrR (DeoR family)